MKNFKDNTEYKNYMGNLQNKIDRAYFKFDHKLARGASPRSSAVTYLVAYIDAAELEQRRLEDMYFPWGWR